MRKIYHTRAVLLLKILLEKISLTYRSLIVLTVSFFSLAHFSCSDSPTSIGKEYLPQQIQVLELNSFTDSLLQSSSVSKRVFSLSNSTRLLLGKKDNVEAGILMKFLIFFADSIKQQILNNQLNVISAKVELTKNYTFGNNSSALDYSVHQVTNKWSTGFTSDSLSSLTFDANDLSTGKTFTDSLNTFSISSQTAFNWLKSYADTGMTQSNGIYLKPSSSSGKIIGFQALVEDEDSPIPYLRMIVENPGVYQDTLSYFPSIDLSVVSGNLPDVGTENIGIQAGLNSRARVYFDLSKLPKNATINFAKLTVTLDTLKTVTGTNFENSLAVYYVKDSASLAYDSTFSLQLDREGNTFSGDVTAIIGLMTSQQENHGFMIFPGDKFNGVELFAIKGSNASNLADRPKLQIKYTTNK